MLWLVNPDEEILDWEAVCGKTARTVWREGREVSSLLYPYLISTQISTDSGFMPTHIFGNLSKRNIFLMHYLDMVSFFLG